MNPLKPKIKPNSGDQVAHGASQVMFANVMFAVICLLTCGLLLLLSEKIGNGTLGTLLFLMFLFNLHVFSKQLYTIIALKLANRANYLKTETGAMVAAFVAAVIVAAFSVHYFELLPVVDQNRLFIMFFIIVSATVIARVSGLIPNLFRKSTSFANQYPVTDRSLISESEMAFYVPKKKLLVLNIIYYVIPIVSGGLLINLI